MGRRLEAKASDGLLGLPGLVRLFVRVLGGKPRWMRCGTYIPALILAVFPGRAGRVIAPRPFKYMYNLLPSLLLDTP